MLYLLQLHDTMNASRAWAAYMNAEPARIPRGGDRIASLLYRCRFESARNLLPPGADVA